MDILLSGLATLHKRYSPNNLEQEVKLIHNIILYIILIHIILPLHSNLAYNSIFYSLRLSLHRMVSSYGGDGSGPKLKHMNA